MTKYALFLIGGLIGISALALVLTRTHDVGRFGEALSTTAVDKTTPEGLFVPNFDRAPLDAYLYLRRNRSVLLIKARSIELRTGALDGRLQFRVRFIGGNDSPKVEASNPDPLYDGFTTVRFNQLYDGVDLGLTEKAGMIGATFILEPGTDAGEVMLKLENSRSDPIRTPSAYQIIDGRRVPVAASFEPARFGARQLQIEEAAPAAAVHVDFEIVL